MPWTIYRYILKELLKLISLSVAVLVTMISFAAAIKPLSEGLLSPSSMLKFVGYSAPTMLGFALPFAGAFASTLVFIRMATDNEILACSTSGLSYAKVLAPVAGLGLCLTMALFYLSNFVVPSFYRAAAETLESDLMTVLVSQLNQNRPFTEIDGYVIYADSATQMPAPAYTGATKFIRLTGVAVGQLDGQGRVRSDSTAKVANILMFQGKERSSMTIRLPEAMRYQADTGELEYAQSLSYGPEELPSPFADDPNFLSWPQLRLLYQDPGRFGDVRDAKEELAREVAIAELRISIRDHLKADHGERGVRLLGSRLSYRITSPSVRTLGGDLILESSKGQPVIVEYPADGPAQRRIEATSGSIAINPGQPSLEPTASLSLIDARIFKVPATEPSTEKRAHTIPRMFWPTSITNPLTDGQPLTRDEQITRLEIVAERHLGRSRHVDRAKVGLDKNIQKLGRKIIAQLHQRAASAITCMMLLVFGSLLAIQLKGQLPLTVFFWSFLLAIVSIIVIHTGQNIAIAKQDSIIEGLTVLWAGNAGMAVAILMVYHKLARN